jgi:hypothetical protein
MQLIKTQTMKRILILVFIIFSFISQSIGNNEIIQLEKKIDSLHAVLKTLKSSQVKILQNQQQSSSQVLKIQESLKQLQEKSIINEKAINETADTLGTKITISEQSANDRISQVDRSLSKSTLIIGSVILLIVILSTFLYRNAWRRQNTQKSAFEKKLEDTKRSIEEEQVQINTKLAELYNGQMEMLRMERKGVQANAVTDHSLALKVADEIVKMQMNLSHMDSKVRGHRQLSIAVSNVFDNFRANGYEITDLLNKPFVEGMNIDYTIEPDTNLKENEKIISRVIKPEVLFHNEIIQNAKVIVSFGE